MSAIEFDNMDHIEELARLLGHHDDDFKDISPNVDDLDFNLRHLCEVKTIVLELVAMKKDVLEYIKGYSKECDDKCKKEVDKSLKDKFPFKQNLTQEENNQLKFNKGQETKRVTSLFRAKARRYKDGNMYGNIKQVIVYVIYYHFEESKDMFDNDHATDKIRELRELLFGEQPNP